MARGKSKKTRDAIIFHLIRFFLGVGRFLPAWFGHFLGSSLGRLGYHLAARDRKKALKNLALAYGNSLDEKAIKKIAKGCFRHFGITLFEVMKIPALTPEKIEKKVKFKGREIIEEAISSGRGVIIATGHIGNWELMGAAASKTGITMNVIARKVNDSRLNDLLVEFRKKSGIKTILREAPDSARKILRSLRSSEMLALLIDQDTRVDGEFVPFFGKLAHTPTGAAALAHKTGALFAAAAARRVGIGRHEIVIEEIRINDEIAKDHAIIEATAKATELFEEWIRQDPEQWPWFHERWKTRPEEESVAK
jgi:KDO2-lipid IV(A) lauroyltransferase